MNTKRNRRLLILVSILVVGLLVLGGLYGARRAQIRSQAEAARDVGLSLYEQGQFNDAARQLGVYVARYRDDPEVLYKYADAVTLTAEDNPHRQISPIAAWRVVVENAPKYRDARQQLMQQYVDAGYDTEAVSLAGEVLADDAKDARALWAMAKSLGNMRQFEDAVEFGRRYIDAKPADLRGHILVVQALHEMGAGEAQVLEQASRLAAERPDDPRGKWLLAMGHYVVGNRDIARGFVVESAEGDPPTPEFALRLAMLLDQLGEHHRATELLLTRADRFPESEPFRLAIARRLYETGRFSDLLNSSPSAGELEDARGLVLEALALLELGQRNAARERLSLLAQRGDRSAQRWARALHVIYGDDAPAPQDAVEALSNVLRSTPEDPYLHHLLGEAYLRTGEIDLAVAEWTEAARRAPAWSLPALRSAQVLHSLGRNRDAVPFAEAAHSRAPNQLPAAVLYAQVWEANLDLADRGSAQKLAEFVDLIQKAVPGEPRTLAVAVRLAVRQGNIDGARQTMQALLDLEQTPPRSVLLQMADLSKRYNLGLEQVLYERFAEAYGFTPELLYNQALELARQGNPQEGLRLIEQAMDEADPSWEVVRVQYLDYIGDETATSAWRRLAQRYPGNRWIQRVTLESPSAWQDQQLIEQTIERLHRLTGDQGLEWRLARGRLLLRGSPSKQDIEQAVAVLEPAARRAPTRAEPHVLLAAAYQLQGNLTRAVRELGVASTLKPDSLEIALELSRLLRNQGEREQSRRVVQRVVDDPQATPDHLRSAATLLAQLGDQRDLDQAIRILNKLENYEDSAPDVMLAILYRRNNRLGDAERVVRDLLSRPEPDVAAVEFAADFYATMGRTDAARRALERLEDLPLQPGEREMIRANYLSRHVGIEEAVEAMQQAVDAAPERYPLWRNYVVYLLRAGSVDQALTVLDQAKEQLGDLGELAFLDRHRDLVRDVAPNAMNRGLLTTAVDSPAFRPLALEALIVLGQEARGELSPQETDRRLRAMADINSRFLALQSLMVRRYLASDEVDEAVEIASRSLVTFPSAIEAAWMASEAYSAAGQWAEALHAASEWRRRSLAKPIAADLLVASPETPQEQKQNWSDRSMNQPLSADLLIAKAQIELGNPSAARRQIESYIPQARREPERYAPIVLTQIRAMMSEGQSSEAREALRPLLSAGPMWRNAWIELAARHLRSADRIRSWLEEVAGQIDDGATAERVTLAQGWYSLWLATQDRQYFERAHTILQDVAQREGATADALLALAMVLDADGRAQEAEQFYRRALELDPSLPAAQNNLAVILLDREEAPTDDAVELARRAVTQQPYNPDFLDTLALAENRLGNAEQALQHIDKAVRLEPDNPAWRLTQAEILVSAGDTERAERVAREISARWPGDQLGDLLADRYSRLQSSISP